MWIDSVELSLPTQLSWRATESEQPADAAKPDSEALRAAIRQRDTERASLERELTQLGAADHAEQDRIVGELGRLESAPPSVRSSSP